nr:MAG TPA: hypothetical protein [Caudoviricetes sp.]
MVLVKIKWQALIQQVPLLRDMVYLKHGLKER